MNYCGELQHEGAFLASIKYLPKKSDPPSNSQARAIIRYVFTRVVVFFSRSQHACHVRNDISKKVVMIYRICLLLVEHPVRIMMCPLPSMNLMMRIFFH